jgi:gliding motility-associated-like protein
MNRSFYVALISGLLTLSSGFAVATAVRTPDAYMLPDEVAGTGVITTQPISSLNLCQGSAVVIEFSTNGAVFSPSNTFTAELSDASGSFATPTAIGSIVLGGSSIPSNTYIFGVIPNGIPAGNGYRIRVTSSEFPSLLLSDNGADITIGSGFAPSIPSVSVNGPSDFCFGSATTFLTSSVPSGNLWFPGGTNTNPFIGVVSGGCYYTQVGGSGGCTTVSVPVCINVNTPIFTFLAYFENGTIASTADTTITICEGDSAEIGILIEGGVAPFDISYTPDGFNIVTVNDVGVATSANTYQYTFFTGNAGIYQTIGITDNFPTNCGSNGSSGTVIVQTAPPPVTTFSYEPFCGDESGAAVPAPGFLGGGVYSFNPSPSDGASINASNGVISNATIGATYSVQYTVQGPNCEAQSVVNVTVDSSDVVEFSYAPFCGTSNFPTTVAGFQGGGTYAFDSAPADGAQINAVTGVISNVSANTTYIIIYTSPAGACQNSFTTSVTTLEAPVITAVITDSECGQSIGAIDVSVSGGQPTYTYSWSGSVSASTEDLSGLSNGAYNLTVTDAAGCAEDTSFSIINTNQPTLDFTVTDAACGANNGAISLTINNGVGPYNITWSPSGSGTSLTSLAAGTYNVMVVDEGTTCEVAGSATVAQDGAPTATFTVTNSLCTQSVGAIDVTVSGGQSPITHSWSNGLSTEDISGLAAGTYTDTISDANGCQTIINASIINENQFTATATGTNPTCGAPNSGAIDVTISGGDAPFTFVWTPNSTTVTEDANGLSAGAYSVEITDDAGCEFVVSTTLTSGQPPVLSANVTDAQCGQNTGAIDLSVDGGSAGYSFLWDNLQVSEDLMGIPAGDYSVTVTSDADPTCFASLTVSVANDNLPTVTATANNTSCTANTGSVALTITNGSGNYGFVWSGPDGYSNLIDEDINGLAAGTYNVVLTDLTTTCVVNASATVAPANAPSFASTSVNTSCGQNNGLIDITVSGGTEPFNITWNNTAAALDQINLAAGTYIFALTDANNCALADTFEILPSVQPGISSVALNPSCSNDTGSVQVTITDATAPILYNWTKDGSAYANTEDLINLAPGTYILVATDGAGCSVSDTATLQYQNIPTLSSTTTESQCGVATGTVDLTVSGGTPNFTISWTGPNNFTASSEDLSDLAAGCYDVTVIDANGCEVSAQACVANTGAPEITLNVTQPSCGLNNGAIEAVVTGGTEPYTYTWTPDQGQSLNLSNLAAGTYSIALTDANGCDANASATLTNTGTLSVNADVSDASCNSATGSIFLSVSGGVEPYAYLWTPGNSTDANLTLLSAGTYSVVVTDDAGCEATGSFTINQANGPQVSFNTTNPGCAVDNGTIDVTVTGGSDNYTYQWSGPGITNIATQDQSDLGAGDYTVIVTDAISLCADTVTISLQNNNGFNISANLTQTSCGNSNGAIDLNISGAVAPLVIEWSNSEETEDLSGLAAGTYSVTVTDDNGCVATGSYDILPSDPLAATVSTTDVTCGLCNGSGIVQVTSGTAGFSYLWSNGASVPDPNSLCAGDGNVIITDASGCTLTVNFNVSGTPALVLTTTTTNPDCGQTNGAIDLFVENLQEPAIYTWNGPGVTDVNSQDLSNIGAGFFTVEIVDANLCTGVLNVTLTNQNEPTLDFTLTGTNCGDATGAIDLTVTGATAPTFAWTGPNDFSASSEDLVNLAAGTYAVTVTDGQCIVSGSATVVNLDGPSASIALSADTICAGLNVNLTIELTGNGPFTFTYTDGNSPVTVTSFAGSTYTASVTPSATTTYSLTSLVSDVEPSCLGSFTNNDVTVVVNTNPTAPTITADGPVSFCEGGSVVLTSSAQTGNIWNITGPDQFNQSITVTTAGAYSVSVINAFGCADTSESVVVDVLQSTIAAGNDTTVCGGSTIQLQATGGASYIWSPSIYLSGTIIANPTCTPFETKTYVVTGTSACGTSSDTITVNVLPIVNANLGNDLTLCQNAPLTLSVEDVAGATYAWGPASAILGPDNTPSASINTAANTQVYLTTTNTNGCVHSDTLLVTVTPSTASFNIVAVGPTTVCQGQSVVLQASTGNLVTWSNGLVNFDEIEVTESGSYYAVFSGSTCPAYSDTIDVVVIPAPSVSIEAQGATTICDGNCVNLQANTSGTINWTLADGSSSASTTVQACDQGMYYLTATENGCSATDSISITVAPALATPTITLDGSNVICDGQTTSTLVSSYAIGNQWSVDNNPIAGATGNSLEVSLGGLYTVTVTSPEGCSATSAGVLIVIKPVVPIDITTQDSVVCNDEVVAIPLNATGGFVSYTWNTGETTASITANQAGYYLVTGVTADGCVSTADLYIVQNEPFTLNLQSPIKFDDYNVTAAGANDGSIDLTVNGGVGPFSYSWSNNATTEDLNQIAGGTYTVTVTDVNGCPVVDSIMVKEPKEIALPNGFTPNGDGFNDFYVIKGIQGYPGNQINIFNRWGALVYSAKDYQNNWDGVNNDGNLLPDGTYFIVVDLNKEGKEDLSGYIDLRRK